MQGMEETTMKCTTGIPTRGAASPFPALDSTRPAAVVCPRS